MLSDILAAFLYAQLEVSQAIQAKRQHIWNFYHQHLTDWARENGVCTPTVPDHCEQPYHMYYLLLPSLETRTQFIARLKEKGVLSVFHYLPLHLSDMGQQFGGKAGDCPVTEDVSDRLVRLPFYTAMTEDEMNWVVESLLSYRL